jgi:hypothetical protein
MARYLGLYLAKVERVSQRAVQHAFATGRG